MSPTDHSSRVPLTDPSIEAVGKTAGYRVTIVRESLGQSERDYQFGYYVYAVNDYGVICRSTHSHITERILIPWRDIIYLRWQNGT